MDQECAKIVDHPRIHFQHTKVDCTGREIHEKPKGWSERSQVSDNWLGHRGRQEAEVKLRWRSVEMKTFNAMRRDFLRNGSIGVALTGFPALSLAGAAQDGPSTTSAGGIFDVRKFGAVGDGKTVDTPAINRAIEAAASAGGGMVLFPAGTYLCFSIRLKSQVHLYLSQGSTILAADSPKPGEQTGYNGGTYDAAEPNTAWDAYQDYGHNHWHNSLLWGEDLHDLSITGPGLIWGRGLSFGAGPAPAPSTTIPGFGAVAAPRPNAPPPPPRRFSPRGDYPMYQAEQAGVGNKAIALKNCRNVLFRDFSILKGGHFGLLLTGVDNLTIDNLKIDTDRDGIDIDCCQNVRVSNCTVNSPWDDGICPKSSFALGLCARHAQCNHRQLLGHRLL